MAWFGLAKMALQAGTHIYKKRQETKMAMADAQHMHADIDKLHDKIDRLLYWILGGLGATILTIVGIFK